MLIEEKTRSVDFSKKELEGYRSYLYDNFDSIVDFFTRNLDLTPQAFSGQLADRPATSDSKWNDQEEIMRNMGIEPHPLLGKCYHAVRFFQFLGGWDNFEAYTIYKKIPHKIPGEFTTHWFLKDNSTGEVLDPTAAQFDYLDINEYYHLGERASGRLCYYGFTPGIKLWKNFVPPVTTRKFTKRYKEEFGTAVAMEKWLKEEQWWIEHKSEYSIPRKKKEVKTESTLEKFF